MKRLFSYDLEYKYQIPRTYLSDETYAYDLFENPTVNYSPLAYAEVGAS
ncbi:MAG: hypothetical protein ACOCRO_07510 [Halanaerobiales bacterium]